MAKATALDKVRRVRQPPKPKSQSAQIGPDGPKHPGNRQLYDKRGRPDAGARLYSDYPNPKSGNILRCPLAHFYSAVDTGRVLQSTAIDDLH